jgi:hypothetical protein
VSRTRRTSTTKRTSKPLTEDKRKASFTTWQSASGVRHYALAKYEGNDTYHCDVFLACAGYISDARNTTGTEMVVTCAQCLASRFKLECDAMNLDEIDYLADIDLLDHFLDHGAMALGFNPR